MDIQYLSRDDESKLAYIHTPVRQEGKDYPLVMFCGGYRSDMTGTKATYFEAQCKERGQAYVRFDYSGHGSSEGKFEDGTIGSWMGDALAVLDHVSQDPVVLVGSSMGGWISLLVAKERPDLIHSLIGIAAAPDFTEDLYGRLSDEQKELLEKNGEVPIPNDYSDEPYPFTKRFYEEAKDHLMLSGTHKMNFSISLIQGMQDKDVIWETAVKIQKAYEGTEVSVAFVEDGDHSLSRPQDLELIDQKIQSASGY